MKQILLVCAAISAFAQTGRVEGRVLTPAGEPISKATVRIISGLPNGQASASYVELTSSDGRFTAENIPPGRYSVQAQRTGFTPLLGANSTIEVAAGQTKSGVEIRLTRLGVVSGIVTDADGDPVPNAQVRLLRYAYNQGRLTIAPAASVNSGDDRGLFRISNVAAGRYYLVVSQGGAAPLLNEVRGRSAQEVNLPTYYPGVPDLRGAVPITVGSTEISNLNVRMRRGRTFSIQGDFVDPSGAFVSAQITVFPKGSDPSPIGVTTVREKVFYVGNLPAGEYTLVARATPTTPDTAPRLTVTPNTPATTLSGRLDVSLGSTDLLDVTIRLTEGAEITGRITVEGGVDLSTFMAALPQQNAKSPQVRMPTVNLFSLEGPNAQMTALAAQDGTFRIPNVPPLKRILQVAPLPPNAYVKSVRFAGQDITRSTLDLASGLGGVLDIVIGTKGAEINATPPSEAVVTIWPRVPNVGNVSGDIRRSGVAPAFRAQGLSPGEYYVAAWEDSTLEFLGVPEFLARFNSVATKVTVAEGETVSVSPKLIPRETSDKEAATFP